MQNYSIGIMILNIARVYFCTFSDFARIIGNYSAKFLLVGHNKSQMFC